MTGVVRIIAEHYRRHGKGRDGSARELEVDANAERLAQYFTNWMTMPARNSSP